jgi:hypothetical protein
MIPLLHRAILRAALGDAPLVSRGALATIIRANVLSDLFQWEPWRHFDSAADPSVLCAHWRRGVRAQLDLAQALTTSGERGRALRAFGLASHALADFYAHTNWVELAIAQGQAPQPAPLLGADLTPEMLPASLHSGYFSLRYGLRGCPTCDGAPCPPTGYAACHATLNKDTPRRGHGAEVALPSGETYGALALTLAIQTTRDAWAAFTGS